MLARLNQQQRFFLLLAVSILLLLAACYASLLSGALALSIHHLWAVLWHVSNSTAHLVLWNVRLPRLLIALLTGASFAMTGALLQGVTRNPLASPSVLGVNDGASFAMMVMLILVPQVSMHWYLLIAFAGAGLAIAVVVVMTASVGVTPLRLALAGMVVSLALQAGKKTLLNLFPDQAQSAVYGTLGSLNNVSWQQVNWLWPWVLIGGLLALLSAKRLDVLRLGQGVASGLGLQQRMTYAWFMLLALMLAASSVSVVGPIPFVGLIVPHILRMLGYHRYTQLIPLSAVLGALLVVMAAMIAGLNYGTFTLTTGIVVALIAAPSFIVIIKLLRKQHAI